jgi:hypothetical protein
MKVKLTVQNYRCFSEASPASFEVRDNFTAFVGPNNAGKSTLLRMFYELRALFVSLGNPAQFRDSVKGASQSFGIPTTPQTSVFPRDNKNPLELKFEYEAAHYAIPPERAPRAVVVRVQHGQNTPSVEIVRHNGVTMNPSHATGWSNEGRFVFTTGEEFDLSPVLDCARALADAYYVGPFRNALPLQGASQYFDIAVGQDFIQKWQNFKTGNLPEHRERIVRVTDEIGAIFGFNRLDINASQDGKQFTLMVDQRSFMLDELGAGLAQFIFVLGNLAIHPRNSCSSTNQN